VFYDGPLDRARPSMPARIIPWSSSLTPYTGTWSPGSRDSRHIGTPLSGGAIGEVPGELFALQGLQAHAPGCRGSRRSGNRPIWAHRTGSRVTRQLVASSPRPGPGPASASGQGAPAARYPDVGLATALEAFQRLQPRRRPAMLRNRRRWPGPDRPSP
jgi:hypothetical protein